MKKLLALAMMICLSGCLERIGKIDRNIKPYGAHWIKEGMTRESRRNDSWSCGAANTIHAADYVVFSDAQKNSARIPTDKDDYGPDERLTVQWNTCMKSKGYTYLDQCDARCLHP